MRHRIAPSARRLAALLLVAAVPAVLAPSARAAAPAGARDPSPPATAAGAAFASPARFWALRLRPGQDLRVELARFALAHHLRAAFIATCAGSCTRTAVRDANQQGADVREGHFEIVSLTGTLADSSMHVHASFADSTGATFGGHLMDGSIVYTTAEIVIGEMEGAVFGRETDPTYGWRELVVKRR